MECKGSIVNIGKAAKLSNLTVKTVRYYADIGLVKPLKNPSSGYRDFSEITADSFSYILCGLSRVYCSCQENGLKTSI